MKNVTMRRFVTLIFFIAVSSIPEFAHASNSAQLPTVLWHGMGDSCCNPFSMGRIKRMIQDRIPGIYVYSVMVGSGIIADTVNGYYGNVNDQIDEVCSKIQADEQLANGFNAVGFSQGSQFLRALTQRCPFPRMNNLVTLGGQHEGVYGLPGCLENSTFCEDIRQKLTKGAYIPRALVERCENGLVNNLVTFGGQHQGIFGLPKCPTEPEQSTMCEYIRKALDYAAYEEVVQSRLVQAQYWHDPLDSDSYKNGNIFLPDINNENEINETYKSNMAALSNFTMVKFLQDTMVVPIESAWFGFYQEGQDEVVLPLKETPLYLEDRLGLKTLDEQGKLQFLEVEGDHLQFTDEWFLEEIVDVYLT